MRYFSTKTHINKSVRSHRMHDTFSKKRTRKLKFVNLNHEAVSYTDRLFVFNHRFGYGHVCGWTTYNDDFFRWARNVSYLTE